MKYSYNELKRFRPEREKDKLRCLLVDNFKNNLGQY